jgi:hydrogenase expression/formation protein HypE
MRDLTRGGLAAILNELAGMINAGIEIHEKTIPVDNPVKGLCEILGFDPLYLANEGKVLFVADKNDADEVLNILKSHPLGIHSEIIGEIIKEHPGEVVLNTSVGGKRYIDMLSRIQLPRIC